MNAARRRVSVCIPTRNHRRYIAQCLASVLAQADDVDLQVLVGDDESEDGTSEIVAGLAAANPHVITHLRHTRRIGSTANMQGLMRACDGEFIARMDGDDYWLPGKLKAQVAYLEANPGCAAVYTNAITVDEAGTRIGLFNDVGEARIDLAAMLRRGNFLNNSSVLLRAEGKNAWLEADKTVLDYALHLWHARHGWLGQIGQPLTAYRVNAHGSMVAGMNDRVRELYWEAIQGVPRELVGNGDYACGIADFLRRVVLRALRTRQWGLVREWSPRVFAASPYGTSRTAFLVAASLLRAVAKEFLGRFRKAPNGGRLRILYRR